MIDLLRRGVRRSYAESLVTEAIDAAEAQRTVVPGDTRMAELDREISAALIRSLPGIRATLTAEFLAEKGDLTRFATGDQLASVAGLAAVLQQSGEVRYLHPATADSRTLKFVFYQSAFCAIQRDPASKAFHTRKRAEGKRHHQALTALARRRICVLHALLRTRQSYQPDHRPTTTTAA